MSKTTAPLLSFDARGQIGKSQVYSTWKGIQYVRRYVIPANPNTTSQQETRSAFAWLQATFKYLPGDVLLSWNAYAKSSKFTAANGWIKQNLTAIRGNADLSGLILSPAANGGIAAAAATFTAGANQITCAITAPTLPSGWTVTEAIAACIADQDPATGKLYTITSGVDNAAPYSIVLGALTTAQLYRVGAWLQYTKADGTLAYGAAIMGTATPT